MKTFSFFGTVLMTILLSASFTACGGDDENITDEPVVPEDPEVEPTHSTVPKYSFTKTKVYLGEYHTYADVFKPYYYDFSVEQTNPYATVSDERLKEVKDSVNNLHEGYLDYFYCMKNVGMEINGKDLDMILKIDSLSYCESLGRDSLINIWKQNDVLGLFTTFKIIVPNALHYGYAIMLTTR